MNKLAIFNLETDEDSAVLAVSIDWILELAKYFDSTEVISTHIGRRTRLKDIRVVELGGGDYLSRLRALFRLSHISFKIIRQRHEYVIFHHMSPRTAVYPGFLFRLFGIKQGLWYSHSSKPFALRLASKIVDMMFSSTYNSIPINSLKVHQVGHGIPINRFTQLSGNSKRKNGILYMGRISPVKRLDVLITEVSKLKPTVSLTFQGLGSSDDYAKALQESGKRNKVVIELKKEVNYQEVPDIMATFKFFYSGTRNSVDKVALEAALSGCLILSQEDMTLELTGMKLVWKKLGIEPPQSISGQVEQLQLIKDEDLKNYRSLISATCSNQNNLEVTAKKIGQALKDLR